MYNAAEIWINGGSGTDTFSLPLSIWDVEVNLQTSAGTILLPNYLS